MRQWIFNYTKCPLPVKISGIAKNHYTFLEKLEINTALKNQIIENVWIWYFFFSPLVKSSNACYWILARNIFRKCQCHHNQPLLLKNTKYLFFLSDLFFKMNIWSVMCIKLLICFNMLHVLDQKVCKSFF